ncbi:MAG: cytochrome c oxidase subunit II [Blastocatellia bacterium]|nr:cytochrome c oxidase subunit II [Blastocatellia bacterium]
MPRILAIAIWLIALGTAAVFCVPRWGLPRAISAHAGAIDQQFRMTMWVMGAAFLGVHLTLGFVVWRYRAGRAVRAAHSQGNGRLEAGLAIGTAAVFLFLAITGQRVWAGLKLSEAPAEAVQVEVVGQQFLWNFRYPGPDGRFGRTEPRLYNDADATIGARPGPLGIDPRDPAGRDDIVTKTLVVPVDRPIRILLRAKDVTHDFYVPALRLKQDAVPGMRISVHFTAREEGRYEIACAELCGQLHHQMRAWLEVRSRDAYEKWLKTMSGAE